MARAARDHAPASGVGRGSGRAPGVARTRRPLDEDKLADRRAAIATWRDVLSDQPNDAGGLHALERLYLGASQLAELVEILRRKIDLATNDAEAIELLARVAQMQEQQMRDPEEAIAAWLEVLERDGEDVRALSELARLYRSAERWADLLDVHERQAMLYEGPAQTDLQIAIARLFAGPLSRPVEALDRWADVLREDPQHATALEAVEAALRDHELRVAAADICGRCTPRRGRTADRAAVALQSEWTEDATTKLRALLEVAQIRELRLGDQGGAFEIYMQALRAAATEPELPSVLAETERLAGDSRAKAS